MLKYSRLPPPRKWKYIAFCSRYEGTIRKSLQIDFRSQTKRARVKLHRIHSRNLSGRTERISNIQHQHYERVRHKAHKARTGIYLTRCWSTSYRNYNLVPQGLDTLLDISQNMKSLQYHHCVRHFVNILFKFCEGSVIPIGQMRVSSEGLVHRMSQSKANVKARVRVLKSDSKAHHPDACITLLSPQPSPNGKIQSLGEQWYWVSECPICSLLSQVPYYGPSATWALSWSDQVTLPSLPGTMPSLWCIPLKGTWTTCPVNLPEHAYSCSVRGWGPWYMRPRMWFETPSSILGIKGSAILKYSLFLGGKVGSAGVEHGPSELNSL